MILPVFLSLIQENEKTALVKVRRGQGGPWRGLLLAHTWGEEADGGPPLPRPQLCLVLGLLLG